MEWAAVIRDVVAGLLIAGAVGAWVPDSFWQHLFLTGHPLGARLWGPLIGPVISVLSFVCSIGNVPLADRLARKVVTKILSVIASYCAEITGTLPAAPTAHDRVPGG